MTQTYRLSPDRYKKLQQKINLSSVVLFLITVAILYLYNMDRAYNLRSAGISLTVGIVLFGLRYTLGNKRRRKILESYKLTLTENELSCEQLYRQPVTISLNSIVSISKNANGMLIKGFDPGSAITVPSSLEDYDSFAEKISAYMPVSGDEQGFWKKSGPGLLALMQFILFIAFCVIRDRTWSIVTGILLLPFLIRNIIYLQKNRQASRLTLVLIILVTAAVLIALLEKITGANIFRLVADTLNGR